MSPNPVKSWIRAISAVVFSLALALFAGGETMAQDAGPRVKLPAPGRAGRVSVEEALQQRRSVREFAPGPLELADVSRVLWAAQGITDAERHRTAPSAGALYPLEIYLVSGNVAGLPAGVYHYEPARHELLGVKKGDVRADLASAAFGQGWMRGTPAALAIAAVYRRTARKYGDRAPRYVHIEVGHAAQNVYLQAAARGLATVLVGAFNDAKLQAVLGLPADHAPLALMPFGAPAGSGR